MWFPSILDHWNVVPTLCIVTFTLLVECFNVNLSLLFIILARFYLCFVHRCVVSGLAPATGAGTVTACHARRDDWLNMMICAPDFGHWVNFHWLLTCDACYSAYTRRSWFHGHGNAREDFYSTLILYYSADSVVFTVWPTRRRATPERSPSSLAALVHMDTGAPRL